MKFGLLITLSACLFISLIGCSGVSAPYRMKMDRVDQEIGGNRGYLKGTPPPAKERGELKREFIAIDVDLPDINKREEEVK